MNEIINRRNFIKGTAAISALTVLNPSKIFGTQVNSSVRIGIIGLGGRGMGVIRSMSENANVNIIAAADLFEDKLNTGIKELDSFNKKRGFSAISQSNKFVDRMGYGAEAFDWKGGTAGYEGHSVYTWAFLNSMLCKEPAFRELIIGTNYRNNNK